MDSSIILPNGIIIDKSEREYKFYYKSIPFNTSKKRTQKYQKYKCYLQVGIYSPQHIHIFDFDCKGQGKGDGKILLCAALNYMKTELELKDNTSISLTAMSFDSRNPRLSQDRLIRYYNKTYGFEVIKEDMVAGTYRTDMSTTIRIAIDKCNAVPKVRKTLRQQMSNFASRLLGR